MTQKPASKKAAKNTSAKKTAAKKTAAKKTTAKKTSMKDKAESRGFKAQPAEKKTPPDRESRPLPSPEPMDGAVREVRDGVEHVNHPRPCYAGVQLLHEFEALFGDVFKGHTFSNPDGRNTALTLTVELEGDRINSDDDPDALVKLSESFAKMCLALASDSRVENVDMSLTMDADTIESSQEIESTTLEITFWSNARTQDNRDPFQLEDIFAILTTPADEFFEEDEVGLL